MSVKTRMRERKKEETGLPDIVAIEAVDENVAAEVEEVNGGSGNRHLRSTLPEDQSEIVGDGGSAADLWFRDRAEASPPIWWIGFVRTREKVAGEFDNSELLTMN